MRLNREAKTTSFITENVEQLIVGFSFSSSLVYI